MPTNSDQANIRTTVGIPKNDYAEIEKIAREKRVSVAWVVREAVSEYIVVATEPDSVPVANAKRMRK